MNEAKLAVVNYVMLMLGAPVLAIGDETKERIHEFIDEAHGHRVSDVKKYVLDRIIDTTEEGKRTGWRNKEPKFGVKEWARVEQTWLDEPKSKNNPVRPMVQVTFNNGRVYLSKWDKCPVDKTYMPITRFVGDMNQVPFEEWEMEMLVMEHLCHEFFDPCRNDDK